MSDGFKLIIPKEMLERLTVADEKIEQLGKTARETGDKVVRSFIAMADMGVGRFIQRLNEAQQKLNELGRTNITIGGFSSIVTQSTQAIDAVGRVVTAIGQATNQNSQSDFLGITKQFELIAELQDKIKKIQDILKKGGTGNVSDGTFVPLDAQSQQRAVDMLADLKKRLKIQMESTQEMYERLHKEEQRFDKETYQAWLQFQHLKKQVAIREEQEKQERMQQIREEYRQKQEQKEANAAKNREVIAHSNEVEKRYNDINRTYEGMFDQIEQEEKARLAEAEKNAEKEAEINRKKVDQIINDWQRQTKAEREYREQRQRMYEGMFDEIEKKRLTTYEGSMQSSQEAKSIEQRIQAIKNLEKARDRLSETDANYEDKIKALNDEIKRQREEVDKLRGKSEQLNKSHRNLMNTAEQLSRKLALVFSVSAITNYVRKLVEVRGEFELRQRSLQAILQNTDEANKLWDKTVALAVRSPYRVKELVSYTKQLAAYRVESEKLYDTTKMLADVASGLGVDMQRLILAYGQVKAANYLRGTELRQFSEAGINILGELSKYFTELEGRAVSVGEVFERVSKRMVSFADVDVIFKRITGEGGVFYRMQEIQAETLRGMMTNLQDQIDIMLDDIGKTHDVTIKRSISVIENLVENWEDIAFVLKAFVLPTFAAYQLSALTVKLANSNIATSLTNLIFKSNKAGSAILNLNSWIIKLGKSIGLSNRAALGFANSLGTFAKAGMVGALAALAAAVVILTTKLTAASRESKKLQKSLNELVNLDTVNFDNAVSGYDNLITRMKRANEGSAERRDLISQLNSQYGEYLDFVVDEKTQVQELTDAYDDVIARMREKAALSTLEKGVEEIYQSYGSQLESARKSFEARLMGGTTFIGADKFLPTKEDIDNLYNLLQTRIRQLSLDEIDSFEEQRDVFQDIFKGYFGDDAWYDFGTQTMQLIDIFVDAKEKELDLQNKINNSYKETLSSREANLEMAELQNQYAQKLSEIENRPNTTDFEKNKLLQEAKDWLDLEVIDIKLKYNLISDANAENERDKIINWAKGTIKDVNEQILSLEGFTEEELSKILISRSEATSKAISEIIKDTQSGWESAVTTIAEQTSLMSAGLAYDKRLLEYNNRLKLLYEERARILGIELNIVKSINKETVESINNQLPEEYHITIEDALKSQEQLLDETNKKRQDAVKLQQMLNLAQERGTFVSEEELKEVEKQVEMFTKKWLLLGGQESGGGNDDRNSLIDERIKVINDMRKAYEELSETLTEVEAKEGAIMKYKDAFKEAYAGTGLKISDFDFTTESGILDFFDKLYPLAIKQFEKIKVELAKGEYVLETEVKVRTSQQEDVMSQIEDLFGGYEISLELQKMDIPPELAKSLFNLESVTLDELREKILSIDTSEFGEKALESYNEYLKKLDDMERKSQIERLKTYSKYLIEQQQERIKIKLEELRKLREVEEINQFNPVERETINRQIRKDAEKQLAKSQWDSFEQSDIYLQMFEDLSKVSMGGLKDMQERLESLRLALRAAGLPASDLNEILSRLNQIEDEIGQRNPFKDYISDSKAALSYITRISKLEKERANLESESKLQEEYLNTLSEQVVQKKYAADIALKEYGIESEQYKQAKDDYTLAQRQANLNADNLEKTNARLSFINREIAKGRDGLNGLSEHIEKAAQNADKLAGSFFDMADSLGWITDEDKGVADGLRKLGQDISSFASSIAQIVANPYNIGAWISGVSSLFQTIGSIANVGDQRRERELQRELKYVEALRKSYESLKDAIDNAYDIDTYTASAALAKKELEESINRTEAALAIAEDKKNKDEEQIKKLNEDLEDYKQQLDNINQKMLDDFGGFGSAATRKSAAEEFVSAWLEAFRQTGDGLSGLEDKMDDFINNMLQKQLLSRLAQNYINPILDEFNKIIDPNNEGGANITSQELIDFNTAYKKYITAFDQQAKSLAEIWNIQPETSELSDLTGSIQNITEDTANVIAAYLNSIRFLASDNNSQLVKMVNAYIGEEAENPILNQLKIIASNQVALQDFLNSITQSTDSGNAFRVWTV